MSAPQVAVAPPRGLALGVVAAAAAAWVALALSAAGHGPALDHHVLGPVVGRLLGDPAGGPGASWLVRPEAAGPVAATATVLLGWTVMVVAMMLPPALPMLLVLRGLLARHPGRRVALAAGAGAFVAVWVVVGVGLVAGDVVLHVVARRVAWLDAHPAAVAGAVLVVAGLYQFSPLKNACLRACRSPRGFAVAHWRGQRPAAVESATVASAYALSCAGCCWALMAVSFAVGVAVLPLMVVLATLMAAERLAPRGRLLVRPVGVLALVLGAALLAAGLLPADLLPSWATTSNALR